MTNWQKWTLRVLIVVLIAATAFAAGFGLGRYVMPAPQVGAAATAIQQQEQFKLFWEAWRLVESRFYSEKPLDYQTMTYGAIRGMVASLGDRHTAFLTPEQADMFSEDLQGAFGGIGVTISMTDEGFLRVERLIPGGPAQDSEIRAGDLIMQVDGNSILGLDIMEAIALIRGPVGEDVALLIQHAGSSPVMVTIRRALIEMPTLESRMLDGGIAYISLTEFNAKASALVHEALVALLDEEPRGLILDLRGNPGGFLHIVEEIANEFIPRGLILIERSSDGTETRHEASGRGIATDIPLALLVDRGSASASEILAGAVQDNERGVLIGETTYGKGSVQITERLSDGSGLQITIRRWYTPADRQIDEQGLNPDIQVERTAEDLQAGLDPQLDRAISYLLNETER